MALLACLAEVLKRERVPYLTLRHPPAFTAPELSAVAHIPGRRLAKVVICIADAAPVQAVLPAHYSVDLERTQAAGRQCVAATGAGTGNRRACTRSSRLGAMPPFGMMHGHRVFVERCFVGEPELVFNAGTHTDSLCMHYADFADIVHPTVGTFGVSPGRRRGVTFRPE